jgi:hypothetical protein
MYGYHPSMTPGAIIGYRKNGTPIRLIAGGSGEGDGDGGDTTGQDGAGSGNGTGDGTTDRTGGDQGTGSGSGHDGGGSGGTAGDDDKTARTVAAIRDDYKAERAKRQALERDLAAIKAAQAQQADSDKARNLALAKAFGFAPDEPPDPEKLASELAAERKAKQDAIDRSTARERELLVENELLKQARRHGADPDRLADSRSFMGKLGRLDPASDSFADDLADAIKTAVDANPAYKLQSATTADGSKTGSGTGTGAGEGDGKAKNGSKTTAPPARSGGEHNGAPGGNRQWTDEDVARATPQEVLAAQEAGLLVNLGVAPPRRKSRR